MKKAEAPTKSRTVALRAAARESADTAARADVSQAESDTARLSHQVGVRTGRRQMVEFLDRVERLADLEQARHVKDSGGYRGVFQRGDGSLLRCSSWECYCEEVMGRSRDQVDRDLQNLAAFGAEALRAMTGVGISVRKLHALRAVTSEDDRTQLLSLAASANTQALMDQIEAILTRQQARHEEEVSAHARTAEDAAGKALARQRVIEGKNKKIDELEEELARHRMPLPTDAEGQLKSLQEVTISVQLALVRAVGTIDEVMAEPASPAIDKAARSTIEYLAQLLKDQATRRGIRLQFEEPVVLSHMATFAPTKASDA